MSRTPSPTGPAVVTVGESLGLLVAERGGRPTNNAEFRLGFGGAESNVAIGVRRLGHRAAWIGRVGADAVGDLIIRELRAEGVDVHATTDAQVATALMIKQRPRPGSSRITYYRRSQAGSRIQPADLPEGLVGSGAILHVTGISAALSAGSRTTVDTAIDQAVAAGRSVSFDVNHRATLWSSDAEARVAYRQLAERADIVFAGDDEAELLTGAVEPDAQLDAILALGARHAVIKRGPDGAVCADAHGNRAAQQAFPISVVDTVGAGDSFVAGWLTAYLRGADPAERLATGAACGAIACTAMGDWEAAPTMADIGALRAGPVDPVVR